MPLTFRFDSVENWEQLGSYSYTAPAVPDQENKTYPIGFVTLPLTLQNHNIAIRCAGNPSDRSYRYWAKTYYLIEDVEHYGKKLKAENHIADFNLLLKPQSNQSNGNLGLLLGSVFCLLFLGFIGFNVLSNHEQKTSSPMPPSLDSLPIAP